MPMQAQSIETDAGPRSRIGPDRLCIATRSVRPVDDLIRFVAGPDGLVPDLKRRLPGRGVWVTARRQTVADAVRRGAFKRSLKADVAVPADLADLVERLLVRAALDALSIAHKAGEVVCGFAKTEAAIAKGNVAALLHASDASPDGVQKLTAALKRRYGGEFENLPRIRTFTSAELDLALGRANVVHAALLAGRAGETFLARWRDLERFRTNENDTGRKIQRDGCADNGASRTGNGMTETKNPGEKLTVAPKTTLTLKPRVEQRRRAPEFQPRPHQGGRGREGQAPDRRCRPRQSLLEAAPAPRRATARRARASPTSSACRASRTAARCRTCGESFRRCICAR